MIYIMPSRKGFFTSILSNCPIHKETGSGMEDNYVKFDLENSDAIATVCLIIRKLVGL